MRSLAESLSVISMPMETVQKKGKLERIQGEEDVHVFTPAVNIKKKRKRPEVEDDTINFEPFWPFFDKMAEDY